MAISSSVTVHTELKIVNIPSFFFFFFLVKITQNYVSQNCSKIVFCDICVSASVCRAV